MIKVYNRVNNFKKKYYTSSVRELEQSRSAEVLQAAMHSFIIDKNRSGSSHINYYEIAFQSGLNE